MTDGTTMTRPALIEIDRATVYRGSTLVFEDLCVEIAHGEQVAIVGPNGAGKTTLLKLINREIYPVHNDRVSVRILGRERWNVWDLRKHIGIVSNDLQDRYPRRARGLDVVLSGFFSSMGTHGQLAGVVTAAHRTAATRMLDVFGVAEFADVPLENMSTGQQRRCLLARAMVHDPETLILDEPMAGLDLAACIDYLGRVRSMIAEGRNIVLVTHHLHEIPPDIDRVVLLGQGGIIADGPKEDVLTKHNLTATYGVPLKLHVKDGYYFAYPA